jgi:alkylation response protein AidB-like acyl-CoA dehydrogenase
MTKAPNPNLLNEYLPAWLTAHADALDTGDIDPESVLPRLVASGLFSIGLPKALGGGNEPASDGIHALADVAEQSVTAAFVAWGHRAFIEYVLKSPNQVLQGKLLPDLLSGSLAGATGLSNAMKYLGGLEPLQATARQTEEGLVINGKLPWLTNLRKERFVAALAADNIETGIPSIFAVPSDAAGLVRSPDLDLLALRSSNTAALEFNNIQLGREWEIHPQARVFLPSVRPAFLGLQCALPLGLARASLKGVSRCIDAARSILSPEFAALADAVEQQWHLLATGINTGAFLTQPKLLFEIRIRLVELAAQAVQLELQVRGGRAYLLNHTDGFARRWRESAFLPVLTPSVVQLKTELAKYRPAEAAA